jgi:hypothetical protein
MAKKQPLPNETAAAAPARVAKPRAPRVKSAQHSKAVSVDAVVSQPTVSTLETAVTTVGPENPHDAIARIAYSLWEARGYQAGSELEDWLIAEQRYKSEVTA